MEAQLLTRALTKKNSEVDVPSFRLAASLVSNSPARTLGGTYFGRTKSAMALKLLKDRLARKSLQQPARSAGSLAASMGAERRSPNRESRKKREPVRRDETKATEKK